MVKLYTNLLFRQAKLINHFRIPLIVKNQQLANFRMMSSSSPSSTNTKNLIEEIKEDHEELKTFYRNFKSAGSMEEGNQWFNQFVWELSRHSVGEELVLYPLLESINERGAEFADRARKEHHKVKELLSDLHRESDHSVFNHKLDALFQDLQEHMQHEENEDLVFLRENITADQMDNASRKFVNRKMIAPTRPHPSVPEKPAALEAALGLLVAPIDKMRDLFTSFPEDTKS